MKRKQSPAHFLTSVYNLLEELSSIRILYTILKPYLNLQQYQVTGSVNGYIIEENIINKKLSEVADMGI